MKIRINKEAFLSISCCIVFLCINIITKILGYIDITGLFRTIVLFVLCYGLLFFVIIRNPRRFPVDFFFLVVLVVSVFYCNYLFHGELFDSSVSGFWNSVLTLYGGITAYLYIRIQSNNTSYLRRILILSGFIFFVFYSVEGVQSIIRGYWEEMGTQGIIQQQSYSMSFGYNMLFPTVVFLYFGLREKNKLFLIIGITAFLETLIGGSRAAPISVVFFLFLYWLIFHYSTANFKQKIFFVTVFIVVSVLVLLFYGSFLRSISNLVSYFGISSRNIEKMLDSSLIQDLARANYYEKSKQLISSGGLFGHGVFADRYYLGNYCHNIFLELYIQFGYLGGTLVILFLLFSFIKVLRNKNKEYAGLFLVFFSCWFIRLLVSYSFCLDIRFWMSLGLCYSFLMSDHFTKQINGQGFD